MKIRSSPINGIDACLAGLEQDLKYNHLDKDNSLEMYNKALRNIHDIERIIDEYKAARKVLIDAQSNNQ